MRINILQNILEYFAIYEKSLNEKNEITGYRKMLCSEKFKNLNGAFETAGNRMGELQMRWEGRQGVLFVS